MLVERWESQSALEAHLRSEAYRRVLGAVELSGSAPEVRFDYVSATDGIELIERSRDTGREDGRSLIGRDESRLDSVGPRPPRRLDPQGAVMLGLTRSEP